MGEALKIEIVIIDQHLSQTVLDQQEKHLRIEVPIQVIFILINAEPMHLLHLSLPQLPQHLPLFGVFGSFIVDHYDGVGELAPHSDSVENSVVQGHKPFVFLASDVLAHLVRAQVSLEVVVEEVLQNLLAELSLEVKSPHLLSHVQKHQLILPHKIVDEFRKRVFSRHLHYLPAVFVSLGHLQCLLQVFSSQVLDEQTGNLHLQTDVFALLVVVHGLRKLVFSDEIDLLAQLPLLFHSYYLVLVFSVNPHVFLGVVSSNSLYFLSGQAIVQLLGVNELLDEVKLVSMIQVKLLVAVDEAMVVMLVNV